MPAAAMMSTEGTVAPPAIPAPAMVTSHAYRIVTNQAEACNNEYEKNEP
jgi:hypothetical protein